MRKAWVEVKSQQRYLRQRCEELQQELLLPQHSAKLDKPLRAWVQPLDRGLPLALLDHPLGEVVRTPFPTIAAKRGIGIGKLASLLKLLERAVRLEPFPEVETKDAGTELIIPQPQEPVLPVDGCKFELVSTAVWDRWRTCILAHSLEHEPIGRFVPSLLDAPYVFWWAPLSIFAERPFPQLRKLYGYGEKRHRVVLEAFFKIYAVLSQVGPAKHLVVRLMPRLVAQADAWARRALATPGVPSAQEIASGFLAPLLEQIRIDAGEQIHRLLCERLGINGPIWNVQRLAQRVGLTRARIYQFFERVAEILALRWPEGKWKSLALREKFLRESQQATHPPEISLFLVAVDIFCPPDHKEAIGPFRPTRIPGAGRGDGDKVKGEPPPRGY
jgi:hypothetical protein